MNQKAFSSKLFHKLLKLCLQRRVLAESSHHLLKLPLLVVLLLLRPQTTWRTEPRPRPWPPEASQTKAWPSKASLVLVFDQVLFHLQVASESISSVSYKRDLITSKLASVVEVEVVCLSRVLGLQEIVIFKLRVCHVMRVYCG